MIRRIAALALLVVLGCDEKASDGLPPTVIINADQAGTATGRVSEAGRRLEWPGDFTLWNGTNIDHGTMLPGCPSGWFNKRLDDVFSVWKCSDYPDVVFGKGELIVHTRGPRVFMVTTTVACDDARSCSVKRQKLIDVNKERNLSVPEAQTKLVDNIWNLNTYFVALSAEHLGFSVMYVDALEKLDTMVKLQRQQNDPPLLNRTYALGDIRYRLNAVTHRDEVGRGKERWSAKQDAVFVVVDYEVENHRRAIVQEDPATFTFVTQNKIYEPDPKAEDYHRRADRTGLLVTPLEYKSHKPRMHVFEVKRADLARPTLLVVSRGDEKLVYQLQ